MVIVCGELETRLRTGSTAELKNAILFNKSRETDQLPLLG